MFRIAITKENTVVKDRLGKEYLEGTPDFREGAVGMVTLTITK